MYVLGMAPCVGLPMTLCDESCGTGGNGMEKMQPRALGALVLLSVGRVRSNQRYLRHLPPPPAPSSLPALTLPTLTLREVDYLTLRNTTAAQMATNPGYLATDASTRQMAINRLAEEGRLNSETLCTTCIVEKVGVLSASLGHEPIGARNTRSAPDLCTCVVQTRRWC